MTDKGIREFCEIALEEEFTTPDRVKEVVSDCVRAQRAGKEVPVGEIFMRREYLSRGQVAAIMKKMYGEDAFGPRKKDDADGGEDASNASDEEDPVAGEDWTDPAITATTVSIVDDGEQDQADTAGAASAFEAAMKPASRTSSRSDPKPPDPREPIQSDQPRQREASSAVVPGGGMSGMVDQLRAERTIRVPWTFWPFAVAAMVVSFLLAGIFHDWLEGDSDTTDSPPPTVVLSPEMKELIALDRPRWVDTDGSGRMVLIVGYRNIAERSRLPRRVKAFAIHSQAKIEAITVAVPEQATDSMGGVLVLPFAHPRLIESVALYPAEDGGDR